VVQCYSLKREAILSKNEARENKENIYSQKVYQYAARYGYGQKIYEVIFYKAKISGRWWL
jgi:hypothetical protein